MYFSLVLCVGGVEINFGPQFFFPLRQCIWHASFQQRDGYSIAINPLSISFLQGDSNVLTSRKIFLIPVGPLSQLVPRSGCGWSAGWEWLDCDFVFFNCLRREHSDCDYCHLAWEYGIWYLYLEWENSLDKGAGGGREDCNCLSDASKDYLRALLFSLPESSALRSRSSTSLSLFTAPGDHTVTLW